MKKSLLCLILLSVFSFKSINSVAQVNKEDSLALVDLYDSTNYGWGWQNSWDINTPVSTWYGVTVENKRVVGISLRYNLLWGNIPYSLGNLTKLRNLDLSSNMIEGVLPSTLGNLISLETLHIGGYDENNGYFTDIDGGIPSSFQNLVNLQTLNLSDSRMEGTLPAFIGNMHLLQTLNLSNSGLKGNIPEEYGDLQSLIFLDLSELYITGIVPSSLCKLHNLETLDLYDDYNLSSQKLPDSLFGSKLKFVNLSGCRFKGQIPSSFSNMINVKSIDLSDNNFSGQFPKFKFDSLLYFNISYNNLKGNVLFSLLNSPNLEYVYINNNAFSGTLPTNIFSRNANVSILNLSNNAFSGKFPSLMHINYVLRELYLNNNQFTDAIPKSVINLRQVYILDVSHNKFSGALPILGSVYIYKLDISYNKMKLPLPAIYTYPDQLHIDSNKFDFSGMETYAQHYSSYPFSFYYSPQAAIHMHYNNGKLSVSAGGTLSNNTYKWYRGGKLIATKTGDSTISESADGDYSVTVTNAVAKALTLYSDTITLPVNNTLINNLDATALNAERNSNVFTAFVSPNPVSSNAINLITRSNINIKAAADILTSDGEIVYKKQIEINSGLQTQLLNIVLLPAGIYYLRINNSKQIASIKFIKD